MALQSLMVALVFAVVSTLQRVNPQITNCDVVFRSEPGRPRDGTFHSPNWPDSYSPHMQCMFKFIAQPGERVKIQFDDFRLTGHPPECSEDYIDVYAELREAKINLSDVSVTISGRYCGVITPGVRISLYQYLIISFISDVERSSHERRGFTGKWKFISDDKYRIGTVAPGSICDLTIGSQELASGNILSPTYPGTLPNYINCTYLLLGQPGERVKLHLTDFDLYYGGDHCPYSWLKIHDGSSNTAPLINTIYCGYKKRGSIIFSTQENLFMEFHSLNPPYSENVGFNITFQFNRNFVNLDFIGRPSYHVRGTECDQLILSHGGSTGTVYSPNYPNQYDRGIVCRYYMDGLEDDQNLEKVSLVFQSFDIPRDDKNKCDDGHIAIYLQGQNESYAANHRWCGNNTRHLVTSKGPRLFMVFHAGSLQGGGFKAQYSFLTDYGIPGTPAPDGSCQFYYKSSSQEVGSFKSPRHPHNYPDDTDCVYLFQAKPGQFIRLRFEKLALAAHVQGGISRGADLCKEDWLEIWQVWPESEGGREVLMGRYCRELVPGPVVSEPGVTTLKVLFHSDNVYRASGFSAAYRFMPIVKPNAQSLESACGRNIEKQTTGTFESPQYKIKYTVQIHCNWVITVKPRHQVLVHFPQKAWLAVEGNMATNVGCQGAAVRVYTNSTDLLTPTAEFCGENPPPQYRQFISTSNVIRITFTTSEKAAGNKGFLAAWSEISHDRVCEHGFKCKINNYCIDKSQLCKAKRYQHYEVSYCGEHDTSDIAGCDTTSDNKLYVIIGSSAAAVLVVLTAIIVICYRRQHTKSQPKSKSSSKTEVKAMMMINNSKSHLHNDLGHVDYHPAPQIDTVIVSHQTVV